MNVVESSKVHCFVDFTFCKDGRPQPSCCRPITRCSTASELTYARGARKESMGKNKPMITDRLVTRDRIKSPVPDVVIALATTGVGSSQPALDQRGAPEILVSQAKTNIVGRWGRTLMNTMETYDRAAAASGVDRLIYSTPPAFCVCIQIVADAFA
ncbi:hypothetical protein EVAR_31999_1 [Eumeta japonica]|uniref:Uncharacterized protein n=1 Tax=Eumeta variegata TaxID=151549 RepID=A0A4C1VSL4_EUMVA|nr:hypothetical protein EVAR_31999_1 [Eumeta japonica]